MTPSTPPPARLLSAYAGAVENNKIFRAVDAARRDRRPDDPAWPAHVFLPLERAGMIVIDRRRAAGLPTSSPAEIINATSNLQIFAGWRMGKGIYRFDHDLAAALMSTPLHGAVPEVLLRLPEWCVYVETPGLTTPLVGGGETPVLGAFATLDQPPAGGPMLVLAVHTDIQLGMMYVELGCPLDESLARMARQWRANYQRGIAAEWHDGAVEAQLALVPKILSLLLYLCSDEPDYAAEDRPKNPTPRKIQGDWRLFGADKTRAWDVGVRIGAQLRQARAADTAAAPAGGTHASPRGHIRRAHWHTYLCGPGRAERRLKWIHPVPVNLDAENAPAVIWPVKST